MVIRIDRRRVMHAVDGSAYIALAVSEDGEVTVCRRYGSDNPVCHYVRTKDLRTSDGFDFNPYE